MAVQSMVRGKDWHRWLCRTCIEAKTVMGDVIQDSRVMWLCRAWFKAEIEYCGCAGHDSRLGQALET